MSQDTQQCIFCLEELPLHDSNKIVERSCLCQYSCHSACLDTWRKTESYSCAICRKGPIIVVIDNVEENRHNGVLNPHIAGQEQNGRRNIIAALEDSNLVRPHFIDSHIYNWCTLYIAAAFLIAIIITTAVVSTRS